MRLLLHRFWGVCWIPSMGRSCFLVQNCTRFTKVSCFSVHFCSRLSPISCFARFLHVFVHLCVILWLCAAVCGREFLSRVDILMQFLRWFLRAVYGNVVFFRWNVDAHHKSLVFFRSFLPPTVANPMFCMNLFVYFADICVVLRCALQSVACSSWVEFVI